MNSSTPYLNTFVALIEAKAFVIPTSLRIGESYIGENADPALHTILAFAKRKGCSIKETLLMLGERYQAILTDPDSDSDPNVRALMRCASLDEIDFGNPDAPIPLIPKSRN